MKIKFLEKRLRTMELMSITSCSLDYEETTKDKSAQILRANKVRLRNFYKATKRHNWVLARAPKRCSRISFVQFP